MQTHTPSMETKYLKDYKSSDYRIENVELTLELDKEQTVVTAVLTVHRQATTVMPLVLDGEGLNLRSIKLNNKTLAEDAYRLTPEGLTLLEPPEAFVLTTEVAFSCQKTELEGLYETENLLITQCEPHGFRHITYYLDRPDVLARFTVKLIADKTQYPVLLSNGHCVKKGNLKGGKHYTVWEDPYPKPSYLFACVAGNLAVLKDIFVTQSGRKVTLALYTHEKEIEEGHYALDALKRAMRWDEEAFGREYDLDNYAIVAVHDFNMGAMENKGLNVFNSKYILANDKIATDNDYLNIEAVVGHEYFHNWTGNRVTCRDWFQLSLKEGLTVFREQQFSESQGLALWHRIGQVDLMQEDQFAEDEGPLAHPVQPQSYIEMNNFYTVTVYEKGAEIVRMLQTLLGVSGFRKGMDLYFKLYDGQAVTVEEFIQAMEKANDRDLTQFRRWYAQAGTPRIEVQSQYDAQTQCYTLILKQSCPPTADGSDKLPWQIPVRVSLLSSKIPGKVYAEKVLELTQSEQKFVFENIPENPLPSFLGGFSAPVRLEYAYRWEELIFIATSEPDPFNQWQAAQSLLKQILKEKIAVGDNTLAHDQTLNALIQRNIAPDLYALSLSLPSFSTMIQQYTENVPIAEILQAETDLEQKLATDYALTFWERYQHYQKADPKSHAPEDRAARWAMNTCLRYLVTNQAPEFIELAVQQYRNASTMTPKLGALSALLSVETPWGETLLEEFWQTFNQYPTLVDKWFSLQSSAKSLGIQRVKQLVKHPAFDWKRPNRVYALFGGFFYGNMEHFHAASGSGYALLFETVAHLDTINPQVAARLLTALGSWHNWEPQRRALIQAGLATLGQHKLSKGVYEIVQKNVTLVA